jgi:hypothetical protein
MWAEISPPTTETMSKICQTTKYKRRKRRGRSKEVVERYQKSTLEKLGTT